MQSVTAMNEELLRLDAETEALHETMRACPECFKTHAAGGFPCDAHIDRYIAWRKEFIRLARLVESCH